MTILFFTHCKNELPNLEVELANYETVPLDSVVNDMYFDSLDKNFKKISDLKYPNGTTVYISRGQRGDLQDPKASEVKDTSNVEMDNVVYLACCSTQFDYRNYPFTIHYTFCFPDIQADPTTKTYKLKESHRVHCVTRTTIRRGTMTCVKCGNNILCNGYIIINNQQVQVYSSGCPVTGMCGAAPTGYYHYGPIARECGCCPTSNLCPCTTVHPGPGHS